MGAFGRFLRRTETGYLAWCPGCDMAHYIAVDKPLANGAKWTFNGSAEHPTFGPSLLIRTGRAVDPAFEREEGDPPEVCHSFIRNGEWQFCGDSTHALAGKTVPMPDWPNPEQEQ